MEEYRNSKPALSCAAEQVALVRGVGPFGGEGAKAVLHRYLQSGRQALVWKLDGLSEYDIRRLLVVTGTNLLGLVKHLAGVEAGYFGSTFDRPFPETLAWMDETAESPGASLRHGLPIALPVSCGHEGIRNGHHRVAN